MSKGKLNPVQAWAYPKTIKRYTQKCAFPGYIIVLIK